MKIWINYLSLIHSRPLPEKATHEQKKSRQDFIELIKPKEKEGTKLPKKVYQWGYEKEAMQEGG
ncbi:hypothetical protein BKM15_25965 [Pseudomonas syringae pv. syringae]|nr:hypothetical protein BKM15_25965 [Pseudomonas syringae pv. syringae]